MSATCTCGCCEGTEKLTPALLANRPGLQSLAYRVGTHATFFETMLARLSDLELDDPDVRNVLNPLQALKTRMREDPSIALLDAWAIVADVLTFYQERIANEGYLPTAKERRSILELANLVGYRLRPGVAASVYLAFTMEKGYEGEVPTGVRSQSVPGPGELPQSFETAEKIKARAAWNELKPRMSRPQEITFSASITADKTDVRNLDFLYLKGTATNLKLNDVLLFVLKQTNGTVSRTHTRRITKVEAQQAANRTKITLDNQPTSGDPPLQTTFTQFFRRLIERRRAVTIPPANPARLSRNLAKGISERSDLIPNLATQIERNAKGQAYQAWQVANVTAGNTIEVYAMRLQAALFGHNVPKKVTFQSTGKPCEPSLWEEWTPEGENGDKIFLDNFYDGIGVEDYLLIRKPGASPKFFVVVGTEEQTRAAYGISAKTTLITLKLPGGQNWWDPAASLDFSIIRGTVVYAQSERLELAETPMTESIGAQSEDEATDPRRIELNAVYDGLESGRWLMVSGERNDIPGVESVTARELVMLAGATQEFDENLPGDTTHTVLQLANELAFRYKRDSVAINANVARATHGETRNEVLGSGDSSKAFQQFALRQGPLTYVSATTPSGIESTLEVRVNDVRWRETDSLVALGQADRNYVTHTGDDGKTSIIFGNGVQGSRLPTANENVKAFYRNGLGKAGNAASGQISLLSTRPLGVKSVLNPQAASGGADPEDRDHARQNAALHLKAIDRAVSVRDYADFARAFTGIGKAIAARLSDGLREVVHLTVAGQNDILIAKDSDLYRNLRQALFQFGDPHQPLEVEARELRLIVASAKVKLLPDYLWESVEPNIRAAMLEVFGFERRELGQDVLLSEVISTVQNVPGVDYVDVDKLDALGTEVLINYLRIQELLAKPALTADEAEELRRLQQVVPDELIGRNERASMDLARVDRSIADPAERILPAQLAYLTPEVPDTLVLNPIA